MRPARLPTFVWRRRRAALGRRGRSARSAAPARRAGPASAPRPRRNFASPCPRPPPDPVRGRPLGGFPTTRVSPPRPPHTHSAASPHAPLSLRSPRHRLGAAPPPRQRRCPQRFPGPGPAASRHPPRSRFPSPRTLSAARRQPSPAPPPSLPARPHLPWCPFWKSGSGTR